MRLSYLCIVPADRHGDDDRLPPWVEHFSGGGGPAGDQDPDRGQGDEKHTD